MMLDAVDQNTRNGEIISLEMIKYLEDLARNARESIDGFIILRIQENNPRTNTTTDGWSLCSDNEDSDDEGSDDEGFIPEPTTGVAGVLGDQELSSDI